MRRCCVLGCVFAAAADAPPLAPPDVFVLGSRSTFHARGATVTVTAAPPARFAARANCASAAVGDAHFEVGNNVEVYVERCEDPAAEDLAVADRAAEDRFAVCVPTIRGGYLDTANGQNWLRRFVAHYESLGVSGFFLYTLTGAAVATRVGTNASWFHVAWLHNCDAPLVTGRRRHISAQCAIDESHAIMYFGQNWVINDCIQRAGAAGFGWVLSVDLDEFLAFEDSTTVLSTYVKRLSRPDVFTFGSALDLPVPCAAGKGHDRCDALAAAKPFCAGNCPNCSLCLRSHGRRKHLTNTRRVLKANIHFADRCIDGRCAVHDERTEVAWLRHYSRPTSRRSPVLRQTAALLCPRCRA